MDLFLRILLLVFGLSFVGLGVVVFVRAKKVIQAVQKRKFGKIAEPRRQEILYARIMGVLLGLIGIYYSVVAIASFF